ncbi:D-alanyl-D-alanine carboxypeptidase [Devosia pacifica]|uniref:D-alanyl-D-alanine carboxypeptidase n=1 Tax=Devosia pacifica TaxID=1335967 RepID=A0A918S8G5_9HYPH|nr:D-alanyl-D-alanine carboxypeptidase family protein [Devosia pacifica]GHA26207.1 D-alanyl-D-alanine carboxypeptidase [Devosia pacifica]
MSLVRRMRSLLAICLVALVTMLTVQAHATPKLVVDMDTLEVLYAEDAGATWHPASLTKLMTAFVAFEQIALGKVSLDTPVILSANAVAKPPSKTGLPVATAMTLQDALYVLLVKSANDMAVAVAETVGGNEASFVALMNDAASRMGLSATHFVNPHGLHDARQTTSARDMAVLTLYILQTYPQYAPIFATKEVRVGKYVYETHNELLSQFRGATGMKTGFVCASGLNMVATAQRGGRNLLAVVLGGSSARDRNERAAQLLTQGFNGQLSGTGASVLSISNSGGAPVDMRPRICGAEAKAYVAAQEAAFPMGLEGQPSFLDADVAAASYVATNMGRIREGIPLPRPRPMHIATRPAQGPQVADVSAQPDLGASAPVPIPRPRPVR